MSRSWKEVVGEHLDLIKGLESQAETLEAIVNALSEALRAGGRIYLLGNGGSAADAQHIAGELLGRFRHDRAALPATALSTDTSTLTAIANDLGYEQVFARQVEALVRPGDVVWILSTSGRSPNALAAARAARKRGAAVIGFTSTGGGPLAELCTHALRVPHHSSDRIQEAHALAYHYLCERVEAAFAESCPRPASGAAPAR